MITAQTHAFLEAAGQSTVSFWTATVSLANGPLVSVFLTERKTFNLVSKEAIIQIWPLETIDTFSRPQQVKEKLNSRKVSEANQSKHGPSLPWLLLTLCGILTENLRKRWGSSCNHRTLETSWPSLFWKILPSFCLVKKKKGAGSERFSKEESEGTAVNRENYWSGNLKRRHDQIYRL